jgi:hypothetical protein
MDIDNAVIVVLLLIVIVFVVQTRSERLDVGPTTGSYIKLYESFEFKDLAWEYQPKMDINHPPESYVKQMIKINLKSFDIDLLSYGIAKYDQLRRVEIWSVYDGNNTASSESDFYSSYIEPSYAFRANPAKYELIVKVLPGQHFKLNAEIPIKKIMLIAFM